MDDDFIIYGESLSDTTIQSLSINDAKSMYSVCKAHSNFDIIELRRLVKDDDSCEIIVVDCINELVPSRNPAGILNRERLALVFWSNNSKHPEVRALRRDFPITPHQNHVLQGEPASLCLYFEPWSYVERTWTPQRHLDRVLWWLSESAKGKLHRDDQPLERMYFSSPFEIVLPPDFEVKIKDASKLLCFKKIITSKNTCKIFRGFFKPKNLKDNQNDPIFVPIMLNLPAVVHGLIEKEPWTLGELNDQIVIHGANIYDLLCTEIRNMTSDKGVCKDKINTFTLIIVNIPLCRIKDAPPEFTITKAFFLESNFVVLGEACGVLHDGKDGKFYNIPIISSDTKPNLEWRRITLQPLEVTTSMTKEFARISSGISELSSNFTGIIAGTGALGSALAEIWSREAWGTWTLIDDDHVKAHNLTRHIANDLCIGAFKVDAVKDIINLNYFDKYFTTESIPDKASNWNSSIIKEAYDKAAFVIDATTTLEVPRDYSLNDGIPRSSSVFLTPSGKDCVLLLEDKQRHTRLDSLEAQYYRAILNNNWGKFHLLGNQGHLWVGAGCRDVSAIISYEMILLHAATIARQLRILRDQPDSCIRVWISDPNTNALNIKQIIVQNSIKTDCGNWKVLWDYGVETKIRQMRKHKLPNETGGVILGYVDHKSKRIFMVDALSSPPDSKEDNSGFIRGIKGLKRQLDEASRRTANIVSYIGEWHSHPKNATAQPSVLDRELLDYLSEKLSFEGQPSLMLIVADNEISVAVKEAKV